MPAFVARMCSADFWGRGERSWWGGCGMSVLLHVTLIVGLASWWLHWHAEAQPPPVVETIIVFPLSFTPDQKFLEELAPPLPIELAPESAGGRLLGATSQESPLPISTPVPFKQPLAAQSIDHRSETLLAESLAEEVGPLSYSAGQDGQGGAGEGTSRGEGNGAGGGFFGLNAPGTTFIYVVDCSGSMNAPHESEWKTRFRRLKFELLKSVSGLSPEQRFYIVYFNDRTYPMPAPGLVSSRPQARQPFLDWMARQRAVGQTDPRQALTLALKLRPDVIYFLTDGAFAYKIERELEQLKQRRTAIHTFAFGNQRGEVVLKRIADQNRGQYHYVP